MLFYTIGMIIWWAVAVFTVEVLRSSNTRKEKGEIKEKDMVGAGCLYMTFGLTYMLGEFIYLLFALKYDTYLYPTYAMLGLYILEFLLAMIMILISRITGKTKNARESWFLFLPHTILTMAYFGYMLWMVIS